MPERIPQCSDCGRVRVGLVWKWDDSVQPVYAGFCPTCKAGREAQHRLTWMREGRRLLARRKRGFGPVKMGEDIFKGMRGEK